MNLDANPTLRSWAEIDIVALRHNAAFARERIGAGVQLMAVVKANAYATASARVASAGRSGGFFRRGERREARERASICLTRASSSSDRRFEERAQIVAGGFIPSVSNAAEGARLRRPLLRSWSPFTSLSILAWAASAPGRTT